MHEESDLSRTTDRQPVFIAVAILASLRVFAHADIEVRIDGVSRAINADPKNVALYLKRAELHRLHRDCEAAAADLDRAHALGNDAPEYELTFHRARMLADCGEPDQALALLNTFLDGQPEHIPARLTRARIATALGQTRRATDDYDIVLETAAPVSPELWIERARVHAAAGEIEPALAGLDEALAHLGPLISLIEVAIDLSLESGLRARALGYIEAVPATLAGHPRWLARKADVVGDEGEARELRRAALDALAAMPPQRRNTRASLALREAIERALEPCRRSPPAEDGHRN